MPRLHLSSKTSSKTSNKAGSEDFVGCLDYIVVVKPVVKPVIKQVRRRTLWGVSTTYLCLPALSLKP